VCSLRQGTRLLPLENRRRWPPDFGAVFLLEVEARVPDEQTTPRRPREPRRQRSRRPAGQQSGKVVGVPTVAAAPRIFVTVTMLVVVVLDVDFVVVFFVFVVVVAVASLLRGLPRAPTADVASVHLRSSARVTKREVAALARHKGGRRHPFKVSVEPLPPGASGWQHFACHEVSNRPIVGDRRLFLVQLGCVPVGGPHHRHFHRLDVSTEQTRGFTEAERVVGPEKEGPDHV